MKEPSNVTLNAFRTASDVANTAENKDRTIRFKEILVQIKWMKLR